VRTLLMLGDREQWQDDNYIWWRRVGRHTPNLVATTGRPTRAPGRYNVAWDGRNEAGQAVGQGAYTLHIEAAREHGGHSYVSTPLTLGASPATAATPADAEIGAAQARYGARR
jgi:thiamine biosynthesis lipoprotein